MHGSKVPEKVVLGVEGDARVGVQNVEVSVKTVKGGGEINNQVHTPVGQPYRSHRQFREVFFC